MNEHQDPITRAFAATIMLVALAVTVPYLWKSLPNLTLQFTLQIQRVQE